MTKDVQSRIADIKSELLTLRPEIAAAHAAINKASAPYEEEEAITGVCQDAAYDRVYEQLRGPLDHEQELLWELAGLEEDLSLGDGER